MYCIALRVYCLSPLPAVLRSVVAWSPDGRRRRALHRPRHDRRHGPRQGILGGGEGTRAVTSRTFRKTRAADAEPSCHRHITVCERGRQSSRACVDEELVVV